MACPVVFGAEIVVEIIWEEKKFENGKDDEQLYGEDLPKGSPQHHGAEAVSIEKIQLFWQCSHARLPFIGQKRSRYSVVYGGHLARQIIFFRWSGL